MDEFTKKYLQSILEKDPGKINQDERDFLQARRSYLTSDQRELFGITEKKTAKPKAKK